MLWLKDATLLRNRWILFQRNMIALLKPYKKSNSQGIKLEKKYKEVTDSLEQKHAELVGTTSKHKDTLYQIECLLDETQQYLRRDCLEITGVTIKSDDNPKQIVQEIGSLT